MTPNDLSSAHVDAVVAQLNPVPCPPVASPDGLDARARADLVAILATDPSAAPAAARSGIRRRSLLLAAAAAAAVGFGFAVPVAGHRDAAYAATPPALTFRAVGADGDAATLLRRIAARVAVLPDDTGSGAYVFIRAREWSLTTSVAADQVTSVVVPQEWSVWVAQDGSGREDSRWAPPGQSPVTTSHVLAPGERSFLWPPGSLSSRDGDLNRQLEQGHPVENGPAERFGAVSDAAFSVPLPPAVRAAILRYLAATPGITVSGATTDRAGRPGIGFSVESAYSGGPTRYTLVVDPLTGKLLDTEEMLTTSAGRLNVRVPCVIEYRLLLDSRNTATLPSPGQENG